MKIKFLFATLFHDVGFVMRRGAVPRVAGSTLERRMALHRATGAVARQACKASVIARTRNLFCRRRMGLSSITGRHLFAAGHQLALHVKTVQLVAVALGKQAQGTVVVAVGQPVFLLCGTQGFCT
mgnify:CR=1 FL=1